MKPFIMTLILLSAAASGWGQSADRIIEKNLFDPSRGSMEETVQEGPAEEKLPQEIPVLDGIISIGNYQRAIFRAKDEKTRKLESVVVKEGDTVGGARIEKVEKDTVMVVFGGKRYKLTVDSKHDMKNVPRTSGGPVARTAAKPTGSKVVERKSSTPVRPATSSRKPTPRKAPTVRPNRAPTNNKTAHRTPFGWTGGKKPKTTKKKPVDRKKTPF